MMPNVCSNHTHSTATTSTFRIVFTGLAIGMYLLTAHKPTPATITTKTISSRDTPYI